MEYKDQVEKIHNDLNKRANDQKDFVGWLELPTNYNTIEFKRIKKAAKKIKKESDILLVIGIGGSYLGARAVIEALTSTFYNLLPDKQRKYPQIFHSDSWMSQGEADQDKNQEMAGYSRAIKLRSIYW